MISSVAEAGGPSPVVSARAPSQAQSAEPAWDKMAPEDRNTLMKFMIETDLAKAVKTDVVTLIRAGDSDCAVHLIMDAYGAPERTAKMAMHLIARSNNLE